MLALTPNPVQFKIMRLFKNIDSVRNKTIASQIEGSVLTRLHFSAGMTVGAVLPSSGIGSLITADGSFQSAFSPLNRVVTGWALDRHSPDT